MSARVVEIWVGLFMAAGMVAILFLSMQVSSLNKFSVDEGYTVKVHFDNVGGLKERSPVSVSGVRVGRVESIQYDMESYEALVVLLIDSQYSTFPEDTSASIFTSGLLGEQYIGLEPGGSDDYLQEGDEIRLAQSAIILEQVIGQFMFNKAAE